MKKKRPPRVCVMARPKMKLASLGVPPYAPSWRLVMWTVVLLLGAILLCSRADSSNLQDLHHSFQNPPPDSRIMMRWWWFGPAVQKSELEREMKMMQEGGIGGFEVQPVYPLALDDQKNIKTLPFLSDEFLDALRFTSAKSKQLGLRM